MNFFRSKKPKQPENAVVDVVPTTSVESRHDDEDMKDRTVSWFLSSYVPYLICSDLVCLISTRFITYICA
jgi:hypothetical protein